MGVASAWMASTRLRYARVLLAFSQIQWLSWAACPIVARGRASSSGACCSQPKSSGAGTRNSRPRFGSEEAVTAATGEGWWPGSWQHQPGGAQHAAGANQRQANQGGGVVTQDGIQQADAQPFAFGAACAVVGLFCAQIPFNFCGAEGRNFTSTGARSTCSKPVSAQTTATAV